jgi:hypothetical protein
MLITYPQVIVRGLKNCPGGEFADYRQLYRKAVQKISV